MSEPQFLNNAIKIPTKAEFPDFAEHTRLALAASDIENFNADSIRVLALWGRKTDKCYYPVKGYFNTESFKPDVFNAIIEILTKAHAIWEYSQRIARRPPNQFDRSEFLEAVECLRKASRIINAAVGFQSSEVLISTAPTSEAKMTAGAKLTSRAVIARQLGIHPSNVTRFVKKHPKLAESAEPGSRIYSEPFCAKWEEEHLTRQRDEEIRNSARKAANADALQVAGQFGGNLPAHKPTTRRR